jgi:uncharacterized protein (TIGR03067 family)
MRTLATALLLAGLTTAADDPDRKEAIEADRKKLEGTWEGYTVDGKGEKADRGPVHLRITITPTRMTAINLGDGKKDMGGGTYRLNQVGTKRWLDATGILLPGNRERTYQGIYELKGDTLRWCVTPRPGERPTEFRTGRGSFLLVLKRKKQP